MIFFNHDFSRKWIDKIVAIFFLLNFLPNFSFLGLVKKLLHLKNVKFPHCNRRYLSATVIYHMTFEHDPQNIFKKFYSVFVNGMTARVSKIGELLHSTCFLNL